MAKKETPNQDNTPKLTKGIFLSILISKQIEELISHYENEQKIEITEHLIKLFEELSLYFTTRDKSIYEAYAKREQELLKKYGRAFKPYSVKQLYKLFDFDNLLLETDYFSSSAEYNKLSEAEQTLSASDMEHFTGAMIRSLNNRLHYLYLDSEPRFSIPDPNLSSQQVTEETDKDITKARQLLAIYYLLKAGFDMEHRNTSFIAPIARFVHLMTGTKMTNMQNSDIYKKYALMPNYKKEEALIKDLKFIRPYFDELQITKAIELIDAEISRSIKELPLSKRKQYE